MSKIQPTLALFNKFNRYPMGKALFSRALCFKAPYFSSISPLFAELRPGYAEVQVRKQRKVLNHLGTVHAIAMCNMAELAGGTMTEVTVPTTHRWIPKEMTVEYLKKAGSDLIAVARGTIPDTWPEADDFIAKVEIMDQDKQVVARMAITMWVSAKKKPAA